MSGRGVSLRGFWWVIAFCSATLLIYQHSLKEKKCALREFEFRLEEMEKERILALAEKDELTARISSQDDPAWIELILMRDLGVVPEGFLKVHFRK